MNAPAPARHPALLAWAVGGVLLGALFGLARYAPASWLADAVQQLSQERLRLPDASGTVWEGSAQCVLAGGAQSRDAVALPSRLHWDIRPGWSQWRVRLHAPCCTTEALELLVEPGWGRFALHWRNGESQWPAAVLAGLGTPWNTVQPQGLLRLRTQDLRVDNAQGRWQVQGLAQLELNHLSSALSPLRPMGSYRLQVLGGANTQLQLNTQPDSALLLVGEGQWVDGRLHFDGSASARAGAEEALSNLLNIVGRREGARSIIHLG